MVIFMEWLAPQTCAYPAACGLGLSGLCPAVDSAPQKYQALFPPGLYTGSPCLDLLQFLQIELKDHLSPALPKPWAYF